MIAKFAINISPTRIRHKAIPVSRQYLSVSRHIFFFPPFLLPASSVLRRTACTCYLPQPTVAREGSLPLSPTADHTYRCNTNPHPTPQEETKPKPGAQARTMTRGDQRERDRAKKQAKLQKEAKGQSRVRPSSGAM